MRVLLVAPPGAGKGTQATKLADHFGVVHLSSGDLLRQEVRSGTAIGLTAADYLQRGDLVPDELIFTMLVEPIVQASRHGGYVLDGFPRNLRQAEAAYKLTEQVGGIELEAVVHLNVARFEVYAAETEPLLTFYRGRGLVLEINGEQDEEKVFSDIVGSFERHRLIRHD